MKVIDYFLTKETFEIKKTDIEGMLKTCPIPQDIDKYYDSKKYISHHQDNGSLKEKIYKFIQRFNINHKRNIVKENTNTKEKISILDYGCGAGEFIKSMEKDCITFGYEPNPIAKKQAQKKSKSTIFINNLDEIKNESLDIITLWHVFEHIENQHEILNQFKQKLKPNGRLIIAVPNYRSYDAQKYKNFWAAYDVPRHIYHFSKAGMSNLMLQEHLKIIKTAPLLLDAFYISMLSEKYKKNPLFWLYGFFFGMISNFKASKTGDFSSLIYIIKKKEKMDF